MAYKVDDIRNVVMIGHGSCGKTTLGEAVLFKSGAITRQGSVDSGNSVLDFDPEEIKRTFSVNLSLAHTAWKDKLINLIDTPGYLDFAGEVTAGLRVGDIALLVINAAEGIEVGTEQYFHMAKSQGTPVIVFVNKMDSENLNYDQIVSEIKEVLGASAALVQLPVGIGADFKGVFDLIQGDPASAPDEVKDRASGMKDETMESIIENSEELLEKYMGGEEIPTDQLAKTLKSAIASGEFIPVLFGSAKTAEGVEELLHFLSTFGPSPADRGSEKAVKGEDEIELTADPSGQLVAYTFKTLYEAHLGEMYLTKIMSGTLKSGSEVFNTTAGKNEKINQMFLLQGKDRKEAQELSAGMIGALVKLKETRTGHTLADKGNKVEVPKVEYPDPSISLAIVAKTREDEEKMSEGLSKLGREDPTFRFDYNKEIKQQIISGLGELHIDVIMSKLKEKFGVSVETIRPRVAFRESIRKPAQSQGRFVKQTGGRGQYGVCDIKIEPMGRGEGYEFVNDIFGGAIPSGFIPNVETGVKKAMEAGALAKCPVVDVKVTLFDGKYHPVDSSGIAFEVAGSMAFKECENKADPYLLEPIHEVEVAVPEEFMGDIMGDLNSRRGKILGMDAEGRYQKIKANVPEVEMYKYSSTLRSITKGRGTFGSRFSHYDEVPRDLATKMVEQARKEREEREG
jgi:elongation factor G